MYNKATTPVKFMLAKIAEEIGRFSRHDEIYLKRTLEIDPTEVVGITQPNFRNEVSRFIPHISSGYWDITELNEDIKFDSSYSNYRGARGFLQFENYPFYKSLVKRFKHNECWKNTDIYNYFIENTNKNIYRYENKERIEDRLEYIDKIYQDMKTNGFRAPNNFKENYEMVFVNVGREGQLFLDDGRHRFCLARILGIKKIPVRILVRHPKLYLDNSPFRSCGVDC